VKIKLKKIKPEFFVKKYIKIAHILKMQNLFKCISYIHWLRGKLFYQMPCPWKCSRPGWMEL